MRIGLPRPRRAFERTQSYRSVTPFLYRRDIDASSLARPECACVIGSATAKAQRRVRLADTAQSTPEVRPLVPHLTLGETRDQDYLNGSRCTDCGAVYAGPRRFCSKCSGDGTFEPIRLSDEGELYVWSIIHQATPHVKTPYVAAIVDLPEGVSVNANIEGVEPDPENLKFGMRLKMFTEQVSQDQDGNAYIAYKFKPAE